MALINCPECGSQVSDSAGACPNCGHPMRGNKPSKSKASKLKTGAIVNVVGGLGYIFMVAVLLIVVAKYGTNMHFSEAHQATNLADAIEAAGTNSTNGITALETYGIMFASTFVVLLLVTVLSIAILAIKRPKRNAMLAITGVQLAASIVAIAFDILFFNWTIVCGAWFFVWGTVVQTIGSIICISGALKLDD